MNREKRAQMLSFWMPGLGQLYQRRWATGASVLGLSSWLWAEASAQHPVRFLICCARPESMACLAGFSAAWCALWIWAVIDCARPGR